MKVEIEDLAGDGVDFGEELTRAKFEELCMDLFKKYALSFLSLACHTAFSLFRKHY